MFPLDDRTVERLAAVIVDIGGPYERKGYQLEQLLARAGWANPPEYDGSTRVPWLAEQLIERKENRAEIERLLCRLCDPLEYDDGQVSADEFREAVNAKLAAERLVVSVVGGRPTIGELSADGKSEVFSAPEDLDHRLRALISDSHTVDVLLNRVSESVLCQQIGAHTMAIIGIGSFVEGLLGSLLTERDEEIRKHGFVGRGDRKIKPDRAGLELMLDVAHEKEWIQLDAKDFMQTVRQYRNFVHPRAELAKQPKFDHDSVTLCWAPVRALLNDLEEHVKPI
ncbi:hypothetical protein [Saccharopolyspora sp. NPDC002686]|uniref:hypothetical protein n=1 Tax=Saccharopolyspora sp. NPDC002686 TaxID=3154541 RepID=UPI00333244BF